MSEQKVNGISEELANLVKAAMPKPGQVVWFESIRPKARGATVLPYDRIFDPNLGESGEYVDIAYITGREPAKGPGGTPKEIHGRIQFTRLNHGRIGIVGGNKQDEQMFFYLFLTNYNTTNVDKPWFIPGKNPVFRQDATARREEEQIEFDRKVRQAQDAIDKMTPTKLREIASGLDLKFAKGSKGNETSVIAALYKIAKTNPSKILGIDKDVSIKMKSDVRRAEKLGLIKYDPALKIWMWPETGDKICTLNPTKSAVDSMVAYFLSSGGKTYTFLLDQIERAEKDAESTPKKKEKEEEQKA